MNNVNHNFLPFEIIELLPKENPYTSTFAYVLYSFLDTIFFENKAKLKEGSFIKISDAWTIIDALTWLEEQGYVVEAISTSAYSNKQWQCVITNLHINIEHDIETIFESRIKAYIAGIKHCLELINQNKNEKV